ncbi:MULTISPECIES: aromatic ring-hydroxylating dioxygenase subunit alpha [unclassified Novosphingobium]|uniref:aromatic ring-hydroxylating dioxygenase subunit alpha n=1 Tax=unclassified Novosphingobium TaxID=2644732 RepID=UPI00146BB6CF|nr:MULTISPECIES: aromatic ring-hydroxylating dioxygenase subunit alpha [unclassified Novosphingobium]NMN04315.1 vanillate O-demethylase monooxygenase subunit [Novosphingobium sp. SG919]NMN85694.1 vanillate O-demethylase monooxygenase subunit [Novosphingobium sp. SG916]
MAHASYPLTTEQPYPRRQWWAAATAAEVGRSLMARDILGERVLLYRKEDGSAVAVSGICPHRAFPLEKGRLVGDSVQCSYHGFTFGADGACQRVPSQAGVPQRAALRHYPLVERGGVLWIWTGEDALADPALLPDLAGIGLDAPGWTVEIHALATVEARYTLLIENLLDLSHVTFIHAATIPSGEKVAALDVTVQTHGAGLTVARKAVGIAPNPLIKLQFPDQEGLVDQEFDAQYMGPSLIRTGGTISDHASGRPLGTQNFIHMITPAAPGRLHYFVATARDFGHDNPALGAMNIAMGTRIQPEDVEAISAIEAVLRSDVPLPREVSARVDNGALLVRRLLEAQIRSEAEALAA